MDRTNKYGTGFDRRSVLKGLGGVVASSYAAPSWAQTPKSGGTLRATIGGTPPDFDVQALGTYLVQHIVAPCYSILMRLNPDDNWNSLIPDLAESYKVSPDGLTVTFKIRDGVIFHDGAPLVIDDVIYSLNRIKSPPKGIISPRSSLFKNVKSIEAADGNTVKLTLMEPQADLPFLVCNPFNAIYPKRIVEPLDAQGIGMKRQVVGTGAFKMERAVDGQIYELVRHEKYFGKRPALDKIQYFPIPGEVERSVALRGNRVDACFLFSSQPVMKDLKTVGGLVVGDGLTPTFVNVVPNTKRKPFDDIRVREAMSLAIDRTAFIDTTGPLTGAAYHSLGLLPPGSGYELTADEVKQFSGYDTLPKLGGNIQANRARAVELLKQAGVQPGLKITIPTRSDLPVFRDSAINVAAQLNLVGFNASVDSMDVGAFFPRAVGGDFDVLVYSMSIPGSLPDQILGDAYTSFGSRNYGKWKDDAIDDLFRAQSREGDPAKRKQIIRAQQLAFLKTYYHISLAWVGFGYAYRDALKGWKASNDGFSNMQLDNVWLES